MNNIEKTELGATLSRSIGSDGMDLIVTSADYIINMATSTTVLDGIPIIGTLTKVLKSGVEIRNQLYLKKVTTFLQALEATTKEERDAFVSELEKSGNTERFGETILLILDHIDDSSKPAIIGRIVAAHISGKIASYSQTMRLAAIVKRVYAQDIDYLRSFSPGVQRDQDIAASLSAAGLLANTGIDGGGADQALNPGGFTYDLNEYGRLLIDHGGVF